MPGLMPDAMGLAEHAEEQVPGSVFEDLEAQPALCFGTLQEPGEQSPFLLGGAQRTLAEHVVIRGPLSDGERLRGQDWMQADPVDDLLCALGRVRAKAEVAIV